MYSSLLLFSPQQGFVAKYFAAEKSPWVKRCFKHNRPPSLPLWTIETGFKGIFNMACSPSGRILVTQSSSAIRLWHPEKSSKSIGLLGDTKWLQDNPTRRWRFLEGETKIEATLVDHSIPALYWTATWDAVTGKVLKEKTQYRHRRKRHLHRRRQTYRNTYSEDLRWIASWNPRGKMYLEEIAGQVTRMWFPTGSASTDLLFTFSPNNEYLAALHGKPTRTWSVHLWSVTGQGYVANMRIKCQEDSDLLMGIYSFQFSTDSERLICYAEGGVGMYIWKRHVSQILLLDRASSNPNGFLVSTTSCTIDVHLKELARRKVNPILSPDGEYVAGLTEDGIFVAETETGSVIRRIHGHFEAIAFASGPPRLASSDLNGTIQVWAVRPNEHQFTSHIAEPSALPVLTSNEKNASVMSYMESSSLDWIGPDTEYEFIVPSPDSRFVCLSSLRFGMHLLDRLSGKSSGFPLSQSDFGEHAFSPDSQWFATSIKGDDNGPPRIQVWSTSIESPSRSKSHEVVSVMRPRHSFSGDSLSRVQAITFSRDSSLLFCSYADISGLFPRIMMHVLNLQNQQLRTIKGPRFRHEYDLDRGVACVSSDNNLVACTLGQKAGMVNVVILQDSGSTPSVLFTKPSSDAVRAMIFSPSGGSLAVHRDEGKLEVYSTSGLTKGGLLGVFPTHTDPLVELDKLETLTRFDFTHDGQQIRTNCGTIHIKGKHDSYVLPEPCLQELSFDGQWVYLGTQKILWLPPEYRPLDRSRGSKIRRRVYFSSNWIWFLDSADCITAIEFDLDLVKELIREGRFV
jgi:WD40 repeat protein